MSLLLECAETNNTVKIIQNEKTLLLTALVSSFASAHDVSGFYLGAGVGSTDFDDAGFMNDVSHQLALQSGRSVPLTSDTDGSAYKLIAGYQINRIIAIEAQYTKYADTDVKVHNISALKLSHDTFTVAANVGYTFNNGLRPFATLGLGSISYEVKENITGKTTIIKMMAARFASVLAWNMRQ